MPEFEQLLRVKSIILYFPLGILTQYQPLELNSYIGIGSAWDLDRYNGGVTVLPPYAESSEVKWYNLDWPS